MTVTDFLQRTGLTYTELLQLASSNGSAPAPTHSGSSSSARRHRRLSAQHVANLSAANADRAHRFARLWRHTPWQMWELDRLMRSPQIGNGALDPTALTRLRTVHRCRPHWASASSSC